MGKNEDKKVDAVEQLTRALGEATAELSRAVKLQSKSVGDGVAESLRKVAQGITQTAQKLEEGVTPRSEKGARTRRELLVAAVGIFAEKGYDQATVDDIAKAAGFTKGAFYAHFASKDEIFTEMARFFLIEDVQRSHPGDLMETLRDNLMKNDCLQPLAMLELVARAAREPEFLPRIRTEFDASIDSAQAQMEEFAALDPEGPTAYDYVIGLTVLAQFGWLFAGLASDTDAATATVLRLVKKLLD